MIAFVICYAPFKGEFEERLLKEGFSGFTLVPKVLGVGGSSDPILDNEVWPGYSVMYLIFFNEDLKDRFVALCEEFSRKVKPFKVFLVKEVEEV